MGSVALCGGGGFEVRRFTAGRPRAGRGSDAAVRHFEASARESTDLFANIPTRPPQIGRGGCHRYEFVEPQAEP